MKVEPKIYVPALKYITCETENVCRLCFAYTDTEGSSLDDHIKLEQRYCDETITLLDMLNFLSIPSEPWLPQVLCVNCATLTTNAYLLKKLSAYSYDKWNSVLDRFSTSLQQQDSTAPNIQTVYFILEENENMMLTSRKTISPKTKLSALSKIKDITKAKNIYHKVKQRKKSKCPTMCEECGEKFSSKANLDRHMKVHSNTRYPCPQCPKVFAMQSQLDIHTERIHYPKKLQCPKCPMKFSTEKMLKYHNKQNHEATLCKLCFVQLPSKKDLRTHLDKHDINSCPRCKKNFMNKQTYKLHLKTCGNNESKRPMFFCDICKKGYAKKNSVRTHLKTDHGFGNVLSCNWCGKKFDAISRLRNHQVKHTKEKNFHCEHCGGKFVTQAALVYHIRLHTGERPFPCDMCNESFLSASRRTEHKRRKHLGPTQECTICHVKFVSGHQLRKHVQRHYNPQSKLFAPDAESYYRNEDRQLSQIIIEANKKSEEPFFFSTA